MHQRIMQEGDIMSDQGKEGLVIVYGSVTSKFERPSSPRPSDRTSDNDND